MFFLFFCLFFSSNLFCSAEELTDLFIMQKEYHESCKNHANNKKLAESKKQHFYDMANNYYSNAIVEKKYIKNQKYNYEFNIITAHRPNKNKMPVAVFIHGGYRVNITKERRTAMSAYFVSRGYKVFWINYLGSTGEMDKYLEHDDENKNLQLEEVLKKAPSDIDYLVSYLKKDKTIDHEKSFLTGFSMGGTIVGKYLQGVAKNKYQDYFKAVQLRSAKYQTRYDEKSNTVVPINKHAFVFDANKFSKNTSYFIFHVLQESNHQTAKYLNQLLESSGHKSESYISAGANHHGIDPELNCKTPKTDDKYRALLKWFEKLLNFLDSSFKHKKTNSNYGYNFYKWASQISMAKKCFKPCSSNLENLAPANKEQQLIEGPTLADMRAYIQDTDKKLSPTKAYELYLKKLVLKDGTQDINYDNNILFSSKLKTTTLAAIKNERQFLTANPEYIAAYHGGPVESLIIYLCLSITKAIFEDRDNWCVDTMRIPDEESWQIEKIINFMKREYEACDLKDNRLNNTQKYRDRIISAGTSMISNAEHAYCNPWAIFARGACANKLDTAKILTSSAESFFGCKIYRIKWLQEEILENIKKKYNDTDTGFLLQMFFQKDGLDSIAYISKIFGWPYQTNNSTENPSYPTVSDFLTDYQQTGTPKHYDKSLLETQENPWQLRILARSKKFSAGKFRLYVKDPELINNITQEIQKSFPRILRYFMYKNPVNQPLMIKESLTNLNLFLEELATNCKKIKDLVSLQQLDKAQEYSQDQTLPQVTRDYYQECLMLGISKNTNKNNYLAHKKHITTFLKNNPKFIHFEIFQNIIFAALENKDFSLVNNFLEKFKQKSATLINDKSITQKYATLERSTVQTYISSMLSLGLEPSEKAVGILKTMGCGDIFESYAHKLWLDKKLPHQPYLLSPKISNYRNFDFSHTNLDYASLAHSDLTQANFETLYIDFTNFSNSNLSKANFNSADIAGVDFRGAKLEGTSFLAAEFAGSIINIGKYPAYIRPGILKYYGAIFDKDTEFTNGSQTYLEHYFNKKQTREFLFFNAIITVAEKNLTSKESLEESLLQILIEFKKDFLDQTITLKIFEDMIEALKPLKLIKYDLDIQKIFKKITQN